MFISQFKAHQNTFPPPHSGPLAEFFVCHCLKTVVDPRCTPLAYSALSFAPSRKILGMQPALPHSAERIYWVPCWDHPSASAFRRKARESFTEQARKVRETGKGDEGESGFPLSSKGKFEPTVCLSFGFIQHLLW